MKQLVILVLLFVSYSHIIQAQTWFSHVDESLSQEYSTSIIQTLEGGYLVAGTETDPLNIEIIKLDALGKKQWSRIFNYQQDSIQWDDIEPYILSKADGSFILGATSYPNTWAIGGYLTLWHVG